MKSTIKAILGNTQIVSSTLPEKLIYTVEEVRRLGIPAPPVREPEKCNFCGEIREPFGAYLWGEIYMWSIPECNCTLKQEYANRERFKELFKLSYLPEKYKDKDFNTYKEIKENARTLSIVKRFCEKFHTIRKDGKGLNIIGNYGSGKTHLCSAIALDIMRQGFGVIMLNSVELFQKLKSFEDNDLNEFCSISLLIIDDLGKEKSTEWTMDRLFYIINSRYNNLKSTIITSNYTGEKIIEKMEHPTAQAIISRLFETNVTLNLVAKDWRKEK